MLPTWEIYGQYSSTNYGAHALVFELPDGRAVWFSYKTPVAFRGQDGKRYVRVNDWSTTTGKHLNAIDGGNKKARIGATEGYSQHDKGKTVYRVDEIVHCDKWDEDRWNECSGGIHFFLTREEAEAW